MSWQIEYLEEAKKDLKKLDRSAQIIVLKGIDKVSENPLPVQQAVMENLSEIRAEPISQIF